MKEQDTQALHDIKSKRAKREIILIKEEIEMISAKVESQLAAALRAVNAIDYREVNILASLRKPPKLLNIVLSAMGLLLGVQENYDAVVKFMKQRTYIQAISTFNRCTITLQKLSILKKRYLRLDCFNFEAIIKCSLVGGSLCKWVIAISKYAELNEFIDEKIAKLKELESFEKVS